MKTSPTYQICTHCVMDTSDMDIVFDEAGRCNHCRDFERVLAQPRYDKETAFQKLKQLTEQIKKKGQRKKYDCLVGISGGVDSCYTAYLCHSWGLKPLLVHMDNGWNLDTAVKNVRKVVEKLNCDYVSYVLDWAEFRDIQLAFLKSSIVDLEMPTDIAIAASLFETAKKYGIKYIVSGGNFSGEGILPLTWGYHVLKDEKVYRHIVRKFSGISIRKTPVVGLLGETRYKFLHGIKTVYPLNLIHYDKGAAKKFLIEEFGWQDYGGKHHESKITGFWQSYVMPTKYNMDYRRATLSSQIVSGQVSREEALEELKNLPYKPDSIEADSQYIAKKYGISQEEFKACLAATPKTYKDFPNDKNKIEWFYALYRKYLS